VVLADPINPDSAKIMREEIRKVTKKPVTHVIYSHNHWDHARGGQIFKDEGATFFAHEACRRHFVERPHPEVVMPDVTFGGNYTLLVGGERIELLYYGRNHSDCLVFMRLRGGRYMFVVDVVSPGAVPWGIVPDTDYLGTIQTIEELEKLEFEVIIPGHAAPLAHPSALTERRLYLQALMSATQAELRDEALDAGFFDRIKGRLADFSYLRGFEAHAKDNINSMLYYVGIGE
jgi:glyoxylase-like metal-dependent hydrolase (beta-lactamase superfamily II)